MLWLLELKSSGGQGQLIAKAPKVSLWPVVLGLQLLTLPLLGWLRSQTGSAVVAARGMQQPWPHSLTAPSLGGWELMGQDCFLDSSWNSIWLDKLGHMYISEPSTKGNMHIDLRVGENWVPKWKFRAVAQRRGNEC